MPVDRTGRKNRSDNSRNFLLNIRNMTRTGEPGPNLRVISAFVEAMKLADDEYSAQELARTVVAMNDHKGELTTIWSEAGTAAALHSLIDQAWLLEGECLAVHETLTGQIIASGALPLQPAIRGNVVQFPTPRRRSPILSPWRP